MPVNQNTFNTLQFTKEKWTGEFVDQNSLSRALLTRPEISDTITLAQGAEKYCLSYLLEGSSEWGIPKSDYKPVGNVEFQWALQGRFDKPIRIVPGVAPDSQHYLGLGFSEFSLNFEEQYFDVGDILKFPCGNLARVQREPVQHGEYWTVTLQLVTNNPNDYILPSEVVPGTEIGVISTAFEENSRGGHSNIVGPVWLKNQMTIHRMSHGASGSATSDVAALNITDSQGRTRKLWMQWDHYVRMCQFKKQMEYWRWYGRYNRTPEDEVPLKGINGRPVLTGAGILEQISPHNTVVTSYLTEDFLQEFLMTLQEQSSELDSSELIVFTGARGKLAFHNALKDHLASANILVGADFYTEKDGSKRILKFGNYFTEYRGVLGTTIRLIHHRMFDDRTVHTALDEKGYPLESSRMVFLNFGKKEGRSNIQLICKSGNGYDRRMISWVTAGSTVPYSLKPEGDVNLKMDNYNSVIRSNDVDGWQMHFLSETGVIVHNPMCCGQIIKAAF
jgi:hypothetical protein